MGQAKCLVSWSRSGVSTPWRGRDSHTLTGLGSLMILRMKMLFVPTDSFYTLPGYQVLLTVSVCVFVYMCVW